MEFSTSSLQRKLWLLATSRDLMLTTLHTWAHLNDPAGILAEESLRARRVGPCWLYHLCSASCVSLQQVRYAQLNQSVSGAPAPTSVFSVLGATSPDPLGALERPRVRDGDDPCPGSSAFPKMTLLVKQVWECPASSIILPLVTLSEQIASVIP